MASNHKSFWLVNRRLLSNTIFNNKWGQRGIPIAPLPLNGTNHPPHLPHLPPSLPPSLSLSRSPLFPFVSDIPKPFTLSRPFSSSIFPPSSEGYDYMQEGEEEADVVVGGEAREESVGRREGGRVRKKDNSKWKRHLFPRLIQSQSLTGCVAALDWASPNLEKKDLENVLMNLGKSRAWRTAHWVFRWMQNCENPNLQPSERDCSIILGILADSKQVKIVHTICNYMKAKGIPFSVYHYTPLVRSFCCHNQFLLAEDIVQKAIKEDEMSMNMWNALIKGYGDAGRISDMFQVVGRMRFRNMPPEAFTYGIMIGCLGQAGDLRRMEKTFAAMKSERLEPNVIIYLHMARAFRVARESEKWESVFSEIEKLGDDSSFVVTCMERFCFAAQQGKFDDIMKMVERVILEDSKHKTSIMNCAMQQFLVGDRYGQCLDAFIKFEENGYKPDKRTVLLLLGALGKMRPGDSVIEDCLKILEKVDSHTENLLRWMLKFGEGEEVDKACKDEFRNRTHSWVSFLKQQVAVTKDNRVALDVASEAMNVVLALGSKKVALDLFRGLISSGVNFQHEFGGSVFLILKVRDFPLEVARMVIVQWLYGLHKRREKNKIPDEWRIETGHKRSNFRDTLAGDLRELYLPGRVMKDNPGYIGGKKLDLVIGMEDNDTLFDAFESYGLQVE